MLRHVRALSTLLKRIDKKKDPDTWYRIERRLSLAEHELEMLSKENTSGNSSR